MFGPMRRPKAAGPVWAAASGSATQRRLGVSSSTGVQGVRNSASSCSSGQQREVLTVRGTPDWYISPESGTVPGVFGEVLHFFVVNPCELLQLHRRGRRRKSRSGFGPRFRRQALWHDLRGRRLPLWGGVRAGYDWCGTLLETSMARPHLAATCPAVTKDTAAAWSSRSPRYDNGRKSRSAGFPLAVSSLPVALAARAYC